MSIESELASSTIALRAIAIWFFGLLFCSFFVYILVLYVDNVFEIMEWKNILDRIDFESYYFILTTFAVSYVVTALSLYGLILRNFSNGERVAVFWILALFAIWPDLFSRLFNRKVILFPRFENFLRSLQL
jgi:hypothetical protein